MVAGKNSERKITIIKFLRRGALVCENRNRDDGQSFKKAPAREGVRSSHTTCDPRIHTLTSHSVTRRRWEGYGLESVTATPRQRRRHGRLTHTCRLFFVYILSTFLQRVFGYLGLVIVQ